MAAQNAGPVPRAGGAGGLGRSEVTSTVRRGVGSVPPALVSAERGAGARRTCGRRPAGALTEGARRGLLQGLRGGALASCGLWVGGPSKPLLFVSEEHGRLPAWPCRCFHCLGRVSHPAGLRCPAGWVKERGEASAVAHRPAELGSGGGCACVCPRCCPWCCRARSPLEREPATED